MLKSLKANPSKFYYLLLGAMYNPVNLLGFVVYVTLPL